MALKYQTGQFLKVLWKVTWATDMASPGCMRLYIVHPWLSGNALVLINVVALRRERLVQGSVTVRGFTIYLGLLSLAIPPWLGAMRTGDGPVHHL